MNYVLWYFRIDLTLELVDKEYISKVKVAKILNIIGKRLELRYYDDEEQGRNFIYANSQFILIELNFFISCVCFILRLFSKNCF